MKHLYLLLLIAGLIACKKEKIEDLPEDNTPVFKAIGTIGGASVNFFAGENGFEMLSVVENQNGIDVVGGILTNGNESLEIFFFDENILSPNHQISATNNDSIDYAYFPLDQNLATLNADLFSNFTGSIDQINYYVDNVPMGNNAEIRRPGLYNVEATIRFNDGGFFTLENQMLLGFRESETTINSNILNDILSADLSAFGVNINEITWYLDGLEVSNNISFSKTITAGRHILKAAYVLSDGTQRSKSILISSEDSALVSKDFNTAKTQLVQEMVLDRKAIVTYKNGAKTYKSHLNVANATEAILLKDLQFYGMTTDNKSILKGNATVICDLIEISSGEVLPINLNCTFAFVIP